MIHYEGVLIAAAAILIIGMFHPIVIKTEYYFGKEAWPVFMILGALCTAASLFTDNQAVGAATAITGAAFLWSIRELFEQEERVKKGWWPENPAKNRCIRKRVKESADKVK